MSLSLYNMNITDFADNLMTFMWNQFVPAFRARGLPFKYVLDVSSTIAETGQTAKVTIAQVQGANTLEDGGIKTLNDTPPLVAEVTFTDTIYNSFGVTDLAASLLAGQPTIPAVVQGAVFGVLNDIELQIVTDIINNVPAANVVGTPGVNVTQDTIDQAQNILVQNYAPRADYQGFVAPTTGAWGQFIKVPNITWAQVRGYQENSPLIDPGVKYGQDVIYNGGRWSQSQSVAYPNVSGTIHSSNPVWMREALAVAVRVPKAPMDGIGCIARNFYDDESGIALQFLWMFNKDTLSEEMVVRSIVGTAAAQPAWSALILGA